jgi:hypothetical protein
LEDDHRDSQTYMNIITKRNKKKLSPFMRKLLEKEKYMKKLMERSI